MREDVKFAETNHASSFSPVQTYTVMRLLFNPFFLLKFRFPIFIAAFLVSAYLPAQECSAPENFESTYYNHAQADYKWDFAADALSYEFTINVNNKSYTKADLPGSATATTVKFAPLLKHNDRVHALLTKHCAGGATKSAAFDFIIIDDAIVYLTGSSNSGEPDKVEPVKDIDENLDPADDICGLCDAGFFRLEANFYGPYGIAVDPAIGPIEQLRFRKNELCTCLNEAIAAGILDENGGPGKQYDGNPFHCRVTPYVFEKEDCPERNQERGSSAGDVQNTLFLEVIPNPVFGIAQISYRLSRETNTTLKIYDVAGRLVHTLINQSMAQAGDYRVEFDAGTLAPGLYFCQLQAEGLCQNTMLAVAPRNR